jgi:diadenosine tetraphosphate (Ap4A) HIT family hydrolase
MMLLARRLGEVLLRQMSYPGMNLLLNEGSAAGQTVYHTHLHLVPRVEGDVVPPRQFLSDALWTRLHKYSDSDLRRTTEVLRAALVPLTA